MTLLHVLASLDPRAGGISQAVRSLVPELEKLGVRNEAVTCDVGGAEWTKDGTLPVHAVGPGKYGYAFAPGLAPWLEENLRRFDAVSIHGLWLWPSIAASLAVSRARKTAKVKEESEKLAVTESENSSELATTSEARVPRLFVMPHGMLDPYFQRDPSRRVKAIRNWIYWKLVEHRVIEAADALLFTCEEERLLAAEPFRPYCPKRTSVVGLGISAPPVFTPAMRHDFRAKCTELSDRPYLLFLSRIHPKKGVDLLIRAYAKIASDLRRPTSDICLPSLVIAGPGWDTDYGREMKQLIGQTNDQLRLSHTPHSPISISHSAFTPETNSPRVHAVDMLTGDTKWGAFHGCEAFVLPSHQENFGIAVVEALACNKPVLISDKVNIWREIKEAGAGLVEQDTEEGCVSLLTRFLGASGNFGSAPVDCFTRHFAIAAAARMLTATLNNPLKA